MPTECEQKNSFIRNKKRTNHFSRSVLIDHSIIINVIFIFCTCFYLSDGIYFGDVMLRRIGYVRLLAMILIRRTKIFKKKNKKKSLGKQGKTKEKKVNNTQAYLRVASSFNKRPHPRLIRSGKSSPGAHDSPPCTDKNNNKDLKKKKLSLLVPS